MRDTLFTRLFREYVVSERGRTLPYNTLILVSINRIMRLELNKNNKIIK